MIRNKESIICHAMSLNESKNFVYNLRTKRMIRENEKEFIGKQTFSIQLWFDF